MASKIFDLPLPLRPVIELKLSSLSLTLATLLTYSHGLLWCLPSRYYRSYGVRLEALCKNISRLCLAAKKRADLRQ